MSRDPEECSWRVNGLTLRGLAWGAPARPPLLALHGWLDNAASFSLLAPALEGFHVVALDLTGHGQSDRRSDDAGYQIWDDLPEILGVVEQLGWSRFNLLGHSRGAIIASLLASAEPQRVERLVLLDALLPPGVPDQEFPRQMQKFLRDRPALLHAHSRVFSSVEAAAAQRLKNGLTADAAHRLAGRGLQPCEGGWRWSADRRLQGASAVKLTPGQNRAVLAYLNMPVLLLLAEGGHMANSEELLTLVEHIETLQLEYRAGGHHFHMEEPVAPLAERICLFLRGETACG